MNCPLRSQTGWEISPITVRRRARRAITALVEASADYDKAASLLTAGGTHSTLGSVEVMRVTRVQASARCLSPRDRIGRSCARFLMLAGIWDVS